MSSSLSVILPVYNVQTYLPACLDSLVAQTVQPMEIIAIDDGSTDACPVILEKYTEILPQLKIIRQENQGLSDARNVGMAAASGDYIHFLDSDDFLVKDAYEVMLGEMQKNRGLDILLFNANYHFEERRSDYKIYRSMHDTPTSEGSDWLLQCLKDKKFMVHMVWMHLYRKVFLEECGMQFIPRRIHEDVIWTTRVLLTAKKVRYIDNVLVNYRISKRCFSEDVADVKCLALMESSILNALELYDISQKTSHVSLRGCLGFQAIDGGLSVFHQLKKLHTLESRKQAIALIDKYSFMQFLFKHSPGLVMKRKILSRWFKYACAKYFWGYS